VQAESSLQIQNKLTNRLYQIFGYAQLSEYFFISYRQSNHPIYGKDGSNPRYLVSMSYQY
jgi:hypothetical protein